MTSKFITERKFTSCHTFSLLLSIQERDSPFKGNCFQTTELASPCTALNPGCTHRYIFISLVHKFYIQILKEFLHENLKQSILSIKFHLSVKTSRDDILMHLGCQIQNTFAFDLLVSTSSYAQFYSFSDWLQSKGPLLFEN